MGSKFFDVILGNLDFLDLTPKVKATKVKISKWGYIKLKSFRTAKDNVHGWISPIILLVFSDGIHHLPDQDHSRDM